MRRHLATQLGFLVPSVHITDNIRLKPREYVVELRGVEVARWEMQQDRVLAISSDPHAAPLEGIDTREPAFGVAAKWIEPRLQEKALASGYAVVDQTSIIATHLAEIVRQHAHELLTRQETKRLLDALAESQPKLVEELVPRLLSLGEVAKSSSAPASRAGFDPRPSRDFGNPAGRGRRQQEPGSPGRSRAPGARALAGHAAAWHGPQAAAC